jgi:hypothetical protein
MEQIKRKAFAKLRELYLQDHRRKYPNMPEYARTSPRYTDKTANGLTKMIIHFIRLNGGQAERINCTGRIIDNRKTFTDVSGRVRTIGSVQYGKTAGTRGTADISATIRGRAVKIEVKIGNDKQSSYQRQYQKNIEAAGGIYIIARNFIGFYNWYNLKFGSNGNR